MATSGMELQAQDFSEDKELIGSGTFSEVFKGTWKSLPVAMKRPSKNIKNAEVTREVDTLRNLQHHNIVVYYGTVTLSDGYYIVTELAEKGSLWDFIHDTTPCPVIDLTQSLRWAKGIASGMQYLHHQGCLHRDLKSGNILLKDDLTAKISDFGSSKFTTNISRGVGTAQSDIRGTYQWMSPEAIMWEESKISDVSDVYSYGIVLYELFTHKVPFQHLRRHELQYKIVEGERPLSKTSDPSDPILASLMRRCWEKEPGNRPTITAILTELEQVDTTQQLEGPRSVHVESQPDSGTGDSTETSGRAEAPSREHVESQLDSGTDSSPLHLGEVLTLEDFRVVNRAVFTARREWRQIGTELGMSPDDLDNFKEEGENNGERLGLVLRAWLQRRSKQPSWHKLYWALRDVTVGREDVAWEIGEKYLKP